MQSLKPATQPQETPAFGLPNIERKGDKLIVSSPGIEYYKTLHDRAKINTFLKFGVGQPTPRKRSDS